MSATPRPWKNKYQDLCTADGSPIFDKDGHASNDDVNLIVRAVNTFDEVQAALEAQAAAINELMTEFVSKTRAAKWDIINEAGIKAERVLKALS